MGLSATDYTNLYNQATIGSLGAILNKANVDSAAFYGKPTSYNLADKMPYDQWASSEFTLNAVYAGQYKSTSDIYTPSSYTVSNWGNIPVPNFPRPAEYYYYTQPPYTNSIGTVTTPLTLA